MSYSYVTESQTVALQRSMFNRIYLLMTFGLLITAAAAVFTVRSPFMLSLVYGNMFFYFAIFFVQIILVIALSATVMSMSPALALFFFLMFAVLNGVSLSGILLAYTNTSIATTFLITAATFAVMSIYGYTTRRDLTRVGSIAIMALLGLIIASLVNLFLRNPLFYWIISYVGVAIFVVLIAADTQKLKRLATRVGNEKGGQSLAILGALILYLDFINLFIYLLRILGRTSRD